MTSALKYFGDILSTAARLSLTLFRLMIPIIIVIKILEYFGFIGIISNSLSAVMEWVGLPGAMGLVWATTMITNLYGGLVVYASIAADFPLSVAQVTVLSFMMLTAHSLPIEAGVAKKAGVSLVATLILRIGMAIVAGLLLNLLYQQFNLLQQPARLLWTPEPVQSGLAQWAVSQAMSLLWIFLIVLALVLLLDILQRSGITEAINRLLRPLLHLLGIGREAETITLIGITLGLSYGGAMLIHQARAGHIKTRDVLFSISLLGLSHSLIEDTLLMLLTGADLVGILLLRILLSLLVIYFLVKLVAKYNVERFIVHSVASHSPE